MKSLLTGVFFILSLQASAQGRYCTNYDDYIAGNWIELPELTFTRSKKPKKNPAAADIIFTTKDKTTNEELDNKAVFIQCGDSLFINLREFRLGHAFFTNHYALAYPLSNNKILFISSKPQESKKVNYVAIGPVPIMFSDKHSSNTYCFIIEDIKLGDFSPIHLINDESISKVLKGHDDLIDEYFFSEKNKKKRELSDYILPLLKKAGMIE